MSRRRAIGWILLIWSLSCALAMPNAIFSGVTRANSTDSADKAGGVVIEVVDKGGTTSEGAGAGAQQVDKALPLICVLKWPDAMASNGSSYDHIYNLVILIVCYLVPISTMAILYYKVGKELWGSEAIGENIDKQRRALLAKKKIVKMMIVVVIIFALCWLPYHVFFLVTYYFPTSDIPEASQATYQRCYLIMYWLAMSNSMYNPIIIYFMNSKFRHEFKRILCFLLFLRAYEPPPPARSSATAVTAIDNHHSVATAPAAMAAPPPGGFGGFGGHRSHRSQRGKQQATMGYIAPVKRDTTNGRLDCDSATTQSVLVSCSTAQNSADDSAGSGSKSDSSNRGKVQIDLRLLSPTATAQGALLLLSKDPVRAVGPNSSNSKCASKQAQAQATEDEREEGEQVQEEEEEEEEARPFIAQMNGQAPLISGVSNSNVIISSSNNGSSWTKGKDLAKVTTNSGGGGKASEKLMELANGNSSAANSASAHFSSHHQHQDHGGGGANNNKVWI